MQSERSGNVCKSIFMFTHEVFLRVERLHADWCTYSARNRSRYEGHRERWFRGVVSLTQPALALLVVVPVHGWKGHVSEQRGPQTSPQRAPALRLHCSPDAVSQLPVRLFLRLQLGADQLQGADHCRWTHWCTNTHTQSGEKKIKISSSAAGQRRKHESPLGDIGGAFGSTRSVHLYEGLSSYF